METIDDDVAARSVEFISGKHDGRQAVLRVDQLHPHALSHPPEAGQRRPGRALAERVSRRDDRPRRERRHDPRQARRARHRRRHHRDVQHRQRAAHEHLARRGDDAVSQREELQLGGRVPGPSHGPLARARSRPGRSSQRRSCQHLRLAARRCWPRPATPTSRTRCCAGTKAIGDTSTRSTSTATTSCPT